MTTSANRFPDWIRRKLMGDAAEESKISDEGTSVSTTGGRSDQEPVEVWEAANLMEAEVVKGRLEAEGIPAIIRSEAAGQIYGLTFGGLATATVLVPALLAEKAIDLLSADPELLDGDESDDDLGPDTTAF